MTKFGQNPSSSFRGDAIRIVTDGMNDGMTDGPGTKCDLIRPPSLDGGLKIVVKFCFLMLKTQSTKGSDFFTFFF